MMRRKDRAIEDLEEICAIIAACDHCHLAMVDDSAPYAVPLNFGWERDGERVRLYFHCAKEGRKMDILRRSAQVAFSFVREYGVVEAATACNYGYHYESVLGSGRAVFLEDATEKAAALDRIMAKYGETTPSYGKESLKNVAVFRVDVEDICGKGNA